MTPFAASNRGKGDPTRPNTAERAMSRVSKWIKWMIAARRGEGNGLTREALGAGFEDVANAVGGVAVPQGGANAGRPAALEHLVDRRLDVRRVRPD
jgi:hypothetical protein